MAATSSGTAAPASPPSSTFGDSCAIHTEEPVYTPDLAYELGRALILWSTHQRRKARDAYRTAHHLPASSIVHDHEVTP